MIVFDLFEQDPNFRKPVEYQTANQHGTVNLANLIKAYAPKKTQPVQFDFPGSKTYKLSPEWVNMLADYYNTLETDNDKAQLVYGVLTDYNKTIRFLNDLAQTKLFEKKSSKKADNSEFKSTKLARLKTQARAKYPAAGSDLEAMAADFVDSQEDDQQEFQRVKDTNKKQDELLKQITAINQQQDQEIDGLDSDNLDLQKNLQQLRAVNTELAKKLAAMAVRKPKEKEKEKTTATTSATATSAAPTTTGVWVPPSAADIRPDWTTAAPALAQPGIPTATPATVGGQPATVLAKPKRKRRTKAEIDAEKASKAAMAAMTKAAGGAKIKPVQPDITPAPTVDATSTIPGALPKVSDTIDLIPGVADKGETPAKTTAQQPSNVYQFVPKIQKDTEPTEPTNDDLFARTGTKESINEADAIPLKKVFAGYTITFDPATKTVSASRGLSGPQQGKSFKLNNATPGAYLRAVRQLLGDEVAEGSVFGQQKFDTQMDLAKLKSQLTQPKSAQSATAEPQPVAYQPPARLSDLQAKHQRVANLADIKKDINALQARATRGGRILPRGLAADLEDYFTITDIDTAYDDMMNKYQKQLGALQQYLGMRKALWSPKKDIHEESQPREYTGEELDQMVAFLSQQMGASAKEIRRMYVDPMIQRGEIKLVDKKSMKAKEITEGGPETWTVHFTDGTTTRVRVPNDETDPAKVRAFFAKKGMTVKKFDYGFGTMSDTASSKPEPHEPGSGTARSARTGEELPEGEVVNINRGGHNAFRDKNDWLDKRDFVQQQLLDPRQRDNLPELKQRLLDINSVGRKLGYTK
jgi:hypothetical protein